MPMLHRINCWHFLNHFHYSTMFIHFICARVIVLHRNNALLTNLLPQSIRINQSHSLTSPIRLKRDISIQQYPQCKLFCCSLIVMYNVLQHFLRLQLINRYILTILFIFDSHDIKHKFSVYGSAIQPDLIIILQIIAIMHISFDIDIKSHYRSPHLSHSKALYSLAGFQAMLYVYDPLVLATSEYQADVVLILDVWSVHQHVYQWQQWLVYQAFVEVACVAPDRFVWHVPAYSLQKWDQSCLIFWF